MNDRIFALNGVGHCFIMTAMGSHLAYEAIRERRACKEILPEGGNTASLDKKVLSYTCQCQETEKRVMKNATAS